MLFIKNIAIVLKQNANKKRSTKIGNYLDYIPYNLQNEIPTDHFALKL